MYRRKWRTGLIAFVLALSMLAILIPITRGAAAEGTPSITIGTVTDIRPGGQTSLQVDLSPGGEAYVMQFALEYDDTKLELVSATAGSVFGADTPTINSEAAGYVYLAWDSISSSLLAGGRLLNLTFRAKNTAAGTAAVSIEEDSNFVFCGQDYYDIPVEIQNGGVSIVPYTKATAVEVTGLSTLERTKTTCLSAIVSPENTDDKSVFWSVTPGTGTASILQTGVLTGTKAGTVTVTATAKDGSGVKGIKEILITPLLVTDIDIFCRNHIALTEKVQLETTIRPESADNNEVVWSIVGGTGTAEIDSDKGELTPHSTGTIVIHATANDGSGVYDEKTVEIVDGFGIEINPGELEETSVLWINGIPYPADETNGIIRVSLANTNATNAVIYSSNSTSETDPHKVYPIGMTVWLLNYDDSTGRYMATRATYFDNLLRYAGCSIRISGKKGIRMITSLTSTGKAALIGSGLEGWTLMEYGTVVAWANQMGSDALVLGRSYAISNYAYKRGVADPVFAQVNGLTQYTNVLVGFDMQQCIPDLAQRSYIKLINSSTSKQIVLYGGTVYRSIGYIAYQNRNAFTPGTEAYRYVWEIIHAVYGIKYDSDYKN